MSQDFRKILVKDNRLRCSDSVGYAVLKGGSNMTSSQFKAVSETTSSHVYNIQIPSEQTIIDRRVMWRSKITIDIVGTAPAGTYLVNYGVKDSLSPFPLHQLTSVMTATINNTSVSINMRDVLPAILRFNDKRELARYNGLTPVMFDTYAKYTDAIGAINNPLGSWINTSDNDMSNRGSWVLDSIIDVATGVAPVVSVGAAQTIRVSFTVCEPLLLSPFIFANPESNNQGFYGVQNMNFVFNIGDAKRVWRYADEGVAKTVSLVSFANSELIFNFLTPHPSDLLPPRNVVPYYEMPRYITNYSTAIANGASVSINSSSIQLNQIPDKLVVFVRKPQSLQSNADADYFLTIKGISINWNNQSGILSSATQQDLYRYSVENGSNQSWFEFSGYANAGGVNPNGQKVPTAGSFLVLEFGKDINITEDFYASGSLGNFNLQFRLEVENQGDNLASGAEVVLITINSGLFATERGTSSTFTGILTKQDVLDASSMESYGLSEFKRMVGGASFMDTLKSVAGKVLPVVRAGLSAVPDARAQAVSQGLQAFGYGMSGGMKDMRLMKK
jgi:hypothetical protein